MAATTSLLAQPIPAASSAVSNSGPAPFFGVISGRVILQNSTEIDQPILIVRICGNGARQPEGYTDMKGYFTIGLGQSHIAAADAESSAFRSFAPGSQSIPAPLNACDIQAALPGYRSDIVHLDMVAALDGPNLGTIILHPLNRGNGLTISATSVGAPSAARKAYEHGVNDLRRKKLEPAISEFRKAIELYPRYAAAWFELGRALEGRAQPTEARAAYLKSIAADDKFIDPYERLYLMAFQERQWQECADRSERVMHLDPYDHPAAFYYNAIANLELHKLAIAERSARLAAGGDTQHGNPQAVYILAVILAARQEYQGAAESARRYLEISPQGAGAASARQLLDEISAGTIAAQK